MYEEQVFVDAVGITVAVGALASEACVLRYVLIHPNPNANPNPNPKLNSTPSPQAEAWGFPWQQRLDFGSVNSSPA